MLNRLTPFALAVLVALVDRWSKIYVQHAVTPFDSYSVVPGWLQIIHTENPGAAFGILAQGNPWLRGGILIGVSVLVLLFVVSALWRRQNSFAGPLGRVALALILGGAAGNLYDRVAYGMVTDFIEVYHGTWSFPAFNVADSAITVGAILLLIDLMHPRHKAIHERASLASK